MTSMHPPATVQPVNPPSWYCGARTRQSKQPCKRRAGWGTQHLGVGRCKMHGGASPDHNKAADKALSMMYAKEALGMEVDIDSLAAMLLSVRLAAGQVAYYRLRLQAEVDDQRATDGLQGQYTLALQNLNRFAGAALHAGVDAKRVAIEERMADVITLAAEEAMGALDLSVKQRAAFTQAFVQALVRGQQEAIDA